MISPEVVHAPVTTARRARLAYVYIRQSSLAQVARHGESTDLQYELVARAVALGWPRDRVRIIDEDLGRSGRFAGARQGFEQLIAEVSLARVGLVLSLDASRLARNNSDWHRLLELCALFGTLLGDGERLYDPEDYHDRLLLGLSGMMSAAEIHQLKQRLYAGARHKAERGDLRLPLPVGLIRLPDGTVCLEPDAEVQERLHLVFSRFRILGSAKAVMRYLHQAGLPLPSRRLRGPAPHPLAWQPATASRVLAILQNPAYAGAYVYGRHCFVPARRTPDHPCSGTVRQPMDQWPICLQSVYPAYITWAEFLATGEQLAANQCRYAEGKHGVPRKGEALLQGIALCGRCGQRFRLRYSGPEGQFPVYCCTYAQAQYGQSKCQEVRALAVDAEVARLVLAALAPDQIALALAACVQVREEQAVLERQWHLRLERARYEAERAHRQYDASEPENRLVARTLESVWEAKLRAVEQLEQDFHTWQQHQQWTPLTAGEQETLLALGTDLPALWQAPTTTAADRKRLLRLVLRDVILDQHRARGKVWLQLNWQTGACTEHWLTRNVMSYDDYAACDALRQRVQELHAAQCLDAEIAATLDAEGFRTARGARFRGELVWRLRKRWAVACATPQALAPPPPGATYATVAEAAHAIGVSLGTIYSWLACGRLQGVQLGKGLRWAIPLSPDQIRTLQVYVAQARRVTKDVTQAALPQGDGGATAVHGQAAAPCYGY